VTTTQAPSARIDYGRATRRRRKLLRRIVVVIIMLAVVVVARTAAPPILNQFAVLRQQARMVNFSPPPKTVTFTNVSDECDRLFAAGTHALVDVKYMGSGGSYSEKIAGFVPLDADPLFDQSNWRIRDAARGTRLNYGPNEGSPVGPSPTLFLHSRRAAGGNRRLVHVSTVMHFDSMTLKEAGRYIDGEWDAYVRSRGSDPDREEGFIRLSLAPRVFRLASWSPGSRWSRLDPLLTNGRAADQFVMPTRMTRSAEEDFEREPMGLSMLIGKPDPNDESKFTLAYTVGGKPGQIFGRLTNADTVEWEVTGPLKQWPEQPYYWGWTP
jgi:hypothetical protein